MYAIFSVIVTLSFCAMLSMGSVLFTAFFFSKLSRPWRVFIASVISPTLLITPAFVFGSLGGASVSNVQFGLSLFLGGAFLALIGWPVAYFSTKKLDAMMKFEVETFE